MTAHRHAAERASLRRQVTELTEQRDQARRLAVALEQELAELHRTTDNKPSPPEAGP